MGYKPTLGGIKKAQEFLKLKGYPMPTFQMDIYKDGDLAGPRWVPGKGQTISIDEAIRNYGAMYEVVDVRLAGEQDGIFIQFSSTTRVGMFTGLSSMENGWDAIPEFKDGPVKDFMDANGETFLNLARWGKEAPTVLDRIRFGLFPSSYSKKVFA